MVSLCSTQPILHKGVKFSIRHFSADKCLRNIVLLPNPIHQIFHIGLCVSRKSYRSRIQTNRLLFVSSIYEYA